MMFRRTVGVIFLVALAGCGTAPKERFYALSMPEPAAATPGQVAYAVAVGPVTVPEMVDRPQIVLRVGTNRMELSELNRWAEPLKRALPRAISASIGQEIPAARVYVASTDDQEPKDHRVRVNIERFESELGKGALVEASWSVRGSSDKEVRRGRSVVREAASGPGYDELVAAHSAVAAAIGRDIASTLRTMKR